MSTSRVSKHVRTIHLFILLIAFGFQSFSGTYGEHKRIGDEAFRQVMRSLVDTALGNTFLPSFLCTDSSSQGPITYCFLKLKGDDGNPLYVTYGDLNALSADHAESPLRLYEELMDDFSPLRGIVRRQHRYLDQYSAGAPDVESALDDPSFVGRVIGDKSHFYDYRKDFVAHIAEFDVRILDSLIALSSERIYTRELYNVTSINKYLTLHSFAIHMAQKAAHLRSPNLLRLAVYINAYADHCVQDAFSAGHRVVHRSYLGSFTNNKFMHDFFGKGGLYSINMRGRTWLSFGDGAYNKNPWRGYDAASQTLSENMQIAIQCCSVSLREVFDAFRGSLYDPEPGVQRHTIRDTLSTLTGTDHDKYILLLRRFGSLGLLPVPFKHSGNRLADEEDASLIVGRNSTALAGMPERMRDSTFEARAFAQLGNNLRIRYLDLRPEKIGPEDLVSAVDHHKGIGLLFIYSRFGEKHEVFAKGDYTVGYSISWKGVANNFLYSNSSFDHLGWGDWWMDISFSNLFVEYGGLSGGEFKFGINHCFEFYSHNDLLIELGLLNEVGWYRLGETQFRWEPSVEVGVLPHSVGLKVRARLMRTPDQHRLDIGLSWDATRFTDAMVNFFDRLFLGLADPFGD